MRSDQKPQGILHTVEPLNPTAEAGTPINLLIKVQAGEGQYLELLPQLIANQLQTWRAIYPDHGFIWSLQDQKGDQFEVSVVEDEEGVHVTDIQSCFTTDEFNYEPMHKPVVKH